MSKSIFDKTFKYTPANQTDVRATFERARRELEQAKRPADAPKVAQINPRKGKA